MDKNLYRYLSKKDMWQLLDLSYKSINCMSKMQFIKDVKELGELFPIDTILYAIAKIKSLYQDNASAEFIDISCPDGYINFYMRNEYYKIDGAIWEFLSTLEPVNWMNINCGPCKNYPESVYAPDFGMNDGWTHGVLDITNMQFSLFFIGSYNKCWSKIIKEILKYIIPFYYEAYQRVLKNESISNPILTPREKEVLYWIKEGKGSWEVSVILNCSKRVVDFHVNNMKRKLNVASRPQLVANALSRRLIDF